VIQPRTKGEEIAYIEGYARAINDCRGHGDEYAREWLRTMIEATPELAQALNTSAPPEMT
jgi:hypothetical protein